MTTADSIREHALSLARSGVESPEAIRELEASSGGSASRSSGPASSFYPHPTSTIDRASARAVELLDELLSRLPV